MLDFSRSRRLPIYRAFSEENVNEEQHTGAGTVARVMAFLSGRANTIGKRRDYESMVTGIYAHWEEANITTGSGKRHSMPARVGFVAVCIIEDVFRRAADADAERGEKDGPPIV